jgi:type IV/VI secretion system ImpK/VasF family protein
MKNEQWSAIHETFYNMKQLCEGLEKRPAADESDGYDTDLHNDFTEEIVHVRKEARTQLDQLRVSLSALLTERECYLALFPIVIHFDEMVQSDYLSGNQDWPLLQKELYQIDDGGDLFFETLDDLLLKPDTLPIIYEVYYLCLRNGFQGRHIGDTIKIREYLKKLESKIVVSSSPEAVLVPEESMVIKSFPSPAWYYGIAGLILLVGYFLLSFITGHYVKPI